MPDPGWTGAGRKDDVQSRALVSRMIGAARLDFSLYEEVKANAVAGRQAILIVLLIGAGTAAGAGPIRRFQVALRNTALPRLLVICPRDRMESAREIMLKPELSLEETESTSTQVDELGVSSLVVRLGGYAATYPSFVSDSDRCHASIETAVEERIRQYLAFQSPDQPRGAQDTVSILSGVPARSAFALQDWLTWLLSRP